MNSNGKLLQTRREVLVVLGAPNSPTGALSDISKSRLDYCLGLYSKGISVLCTGGWGEHFNISPEAHAIYAKRYLIEKGVFEDDFLEIALSQNTVDDARKIMQIVAHIENPALTIITSDYHLDRVKLIFQEMLHKFIINCVGVKSQINNEQLQKLIEHEKKAREAIKRNGLYY